MISIRYEDGGVVIVLENVEHLNYDTEFCKEKLLESVIVRDVDKKFVFDMGTVSTVDKKALGEILLFWKRVYFRRGEVVFVNANEKILRALKELGLSEIFKVYATLNEALATKNESD